MDQQLESIRQHPLRRMSSIRPTEHNTSLMDVIDAQSEVEHHIVEDKSEPARFYLPT